MTSKHKFNKASHKSTGSAPMKCARCTSEGHASTSDIYWRPVFCKVRNGKSKKYFSG